MANETAPSLSISNPHPPGASWVEKLGIAILGFGIISGLVAWFGAREVPTDWFMFAGLLLAGIGGIIYATHRFGLGPAGVRNHHTMHSSVTARGMFGWLLGIVLTGMYVVLYWYPEYMQGLIRGLDPLSQLLRGAKANQWFLYGTIYTLAVVVMGYRAILKYRHSRYQIIRTLSVIFFQLIFAYLIPHFMYMLHGHEFYFSYFWPLKPQYLYPWKIGEFFGNTPAMVTFMGFWAVAMALVGVPILTYFYGKRWYCSWVCGCGGLANTAGDSFRHLSDKSLKAWKIERWSVHLVLVIITFGTALLWINSYYEGQFFATFAHWFMGASGEEAAGISKEISRGFASWYGFFIGMIFAGVVGVGFYPLMGTRVWCRFGCPQAAILGLLQKWFSRFRITANGEQCISCGNCSTYCEMGIDVKWYAQRGQNVIRASCVGCGMCATVCPRGVLNLENGKVTNRYNGPEINERLVTNWTK